MDEQRLRSSLQDAIGYEPPSASLLERSIASLAADRRIHRGPWLAMAFSSGLAAIFVTAVIITHWAATSRKSVGSGALIISPIAGSQVAWLRSQEPGGPQLFVGVDPNGRVINEISAAVTLRSVDGEHLFAVTPRTIDVFSAVTGQREAAIARQSSLMGTAYASQDGHYLAVLEADRNYGIELIDLKAARSVGHLLLGPTPANGAVGWLLFSPDDTRIYLFTNLWSTPNVTTVRLNGTVMSLESSVLNGERGHKVAGCDGLYPPLEGIGGLPVKLLPDGQTIVSYCPFDLKLTWFDLKRLTTIEQISVAQTGAFSAAFSPDGHKLYLHEPTSRTLLAVDLDQRKIVRTATAQADTRSRGPLEWLTSHLVLTAEAKETSRTTQISPDGRTLYLATDNRISIYDLPGLSLRTTWKLREGGAQAISLTPDGHTLFVLSNHQTVQIFRSDGSVVTTVQLSKPGFDFLAKSSG